MFLAFQHPELLMLLPGEVPASNRIIFGCHAGFFVTACLEPVTGLRTLKVTDLGVEGGNTYLVFAYSCVKFCLFFPLFYLFGVVVVDTSFFFFLSSFFGKILHKCSKGFVQKEKCLCV